MAVKSAALKNEGLAAPLLGAKGAIRQKKAPSRTAPHQKGQPPRWGCGGGGVFRATGGSASGIRVECPGWPALPACRFGGRRPQRHRRPSAGKAA